MNTRTDSSSPWNNSPPSTVSSNSPATSSSGRPPIRRPNPDATITIGEAAFVDVIGQRLSLAEAIETGVATASGDRKALRKLKGLFRLPPPRSRT